LSLWICRNDKVFNDTNISHMQVICRCSLCSVHGRLCSVWRCLHGWRPRRGSLLNNMGGSSISVLVRCHLRGCYRFMFMFIL
jgi:hypothetical protein